MNDFYPTVMYHRTEAPEGRVFTSADEFAALGPDWVDTPAKFGIVVPEKKKGKK